MFERNLQICQISSSACALVSNQLLAVKRFFYVTRRQKTGELLHGRRSDLAFSPILVQFLAQQKYRSWPV